MNMRRVYLAGAGIGFFVAPGVIVPLLGLPAPTEVWIHVVGILTAILGMYFVYCAAPEQRRFFQATVIARVMFLTGVASLVVLGIAPPLLVVFGGVDLAGPRGRSARCARPGRRSGPADAGVRVDAGGRRAAGGRGDALARRLARERTAFG